MASFVSYTNDMLTQSVRVVVEVVVVVVVAAAVVVVVVVVVVVNNSIQISQITDMQILLNRQ